MSAVAVWVGVTQVVGGAVSRWTQLGYAAGARFGAMGPPGASDPWYRMFIEFQGMRGTAGEYVRLWFPQPPGQSLRYRCYATNFSLGHWTFDALDDFGFPEFAITITGPSGGATAWANHTGTRADFNAEMFNLWDRAPGSALSPCNYADCEVQRVLGPYTPTDFLFLPPSPLSPFSGRFVAGDDNFDIWDVRN